MHKQLIQSVMWEVFLGVGLFGLLTSTVYSGMVVAGIRRFRAWSCSTCGAARPTQGASCAVMPAVSILKPLHGSEPGLEAHLESFFLQQYPEYEILFCARTAGDVGLLLARELSARYPLVQARFLTSGEPLCANAKVASLAVMAKAAAHDLLVVSDSDVLVDPTYLHNVVAPFADPMVGAVTCLYRGMVPARESGERGSRLWAELEGVGMSIEMTSGVLVANLLEDMQFLLGPTMAMRRKCVDAIGGFESLGQYCSDDFLLGNRIAGLGYDVVLSQHVIDHVILNGGFRASMKHQARWMKSTRFSRPKGHIGTVLTFSIPFAILAAVTLLVLGHPWLAASAFALGIANRTVLAVLIGRYVVAERDLLRSVLLYPVRDLMGFAFWAASYTSNRVLWRGEVFELLKDGWMRPVCRAGGSSNAAKSKERQPALPA